jgi:integrase
VRPHRSIGRRNFASCAPQVGTSDEKNLRQASRRLGLKAGQEDARGTVPVRGSNFRSRVFHPAVKAAGLSDRWAKPLTVHDLRDTAAALLFADGGTLIEVQGMLGHARPSMTLDRYSGVLTSMEEERLTAQDARFQAAQTGAAQGATVSAIR